MPSDEGYSALYGYSQDSIGKHISDITSDNIESEYSIADKDIAFDKGISYYREENEEPKVPKCSSTKRVFPSLLKREDVVKLETLQVPEPYQQGLEDEISALGLTFQQTLLNFIDKKGYKDSQVYRKANIDRKLFSKIRCNKDYKPSKQTALSLVVALELNLDEATDLLGRAGLALSPSNLTDMIVKYCITHQIYDIYDVNALLYEHDQQLLGC